MADPLPHPTGHQHPQQPLQPDWPVPLRLRPIVLDPSSLILNPSHHSCPLSLNTILFHPPRCASASTAAPAAPAWWASACQGSASLVTQVRGSGCSAAHGDQCRSEPARDEQRWRDARKRWSAPRATPNCPPAAPPKRCQLSVDHIILPA